MFSKCGCGGVGFSRSAVQQNVRTSKHFYYQKGKHKQIQRTNHSYADKGFLTFDRNYQIS